MKRLVILLALTGCHSEDYTLKSRNISGVAVPYVTSKKPGPVAFDVFPNGSPMDFTPNTGVAWIDVVSSDIRADGENYESLRLGVMADGTVHVGAARGGSGQARDMIIQRNGGTTIISGALRVRMAAPASAAEPCEVGELAWDESYSYVCTGKDTWRRSALETW